jgi:SIR2-like domain
MTFLLLTGAGFSYNWGGPLASDVFSALLADTGLDSHTRDLLFDSGGAFETVLADLQLSKDPGDQKRYDALITSVVGIFNGMNNTFMHMQFEFENPPSVQHSMTSFLTRFHAIFTLNQDALLEQHYNPMIGPPMNWGHLQLPGTRLMPRFQPSGARQDKFALMEPNPPFRTFGSGAQPYVKLHGSVNWVESNMGKRILIMGGQKAVSIGRYPILTWYHDEFRKMLLRPSAKLMVIGYSFSDSHINDAIVDGTAAGLKLFIVDPFALKVLKNDPRIGSARSSLIGYSDRPLKTTFGGDRYAHAQVSKFFDQ